MVIQWERMSEVKLRYTVDSFSLMVAIESFVDSHSIVPGQNVDADSLSSSSAAMLHRLK